MTSKFYFMHCVEDHRYGVGYGPPEYRFDRLSEGEFEKDWVPITFVIRDGGYADYQANALGWPLCSQKLKQVLARHASSEDVLQWLDATVVGTEGEERLYHILHLPRPPDVLDRRRTVFAGGDFAVKPYLDGNVARRHRVFSYPGGTFRVIVSSEVRDAILAAGCTGLDFYQARVA